jgi:4-amino-4-deoxy-L-arabinose transferase-like glycosyltransferase
VKSALLLFLLAALLHLPMLGRAELDSEEGRRALPAREMLASGDFVLPTIWGEPYLAKPPGMYWAIAGSALGMQALGFDGPEDRERPGWFPRTRGPVSPLAARVPSWTATLLCALLLLGLGRRVGSERAGLWAGVLFLLAPEIARKARTGEIESVLVLVGFASGALLWLAVRERRRWALHTLGGGALLGLALLTKGPIALLFGLAPPFAAVRRAGPVHAARVLVLGLAVALGLGLAWVVPLFERFADPDELMRLWAGEVGRGGAGGVGVFLADRQRFLFGSALGWLPATFVVGLELVRRRRGGVDPLVRETLLAVALPFLVLALWPSVRPRYALPLLPWIALAGGLVVARWIDARRAAGLPAVARAAWIGLGVVLAVSVGQLLVEPTKWQREQRAELARRLDEAAGAELWTDQWGAFNALYYSEARVRFVDGPAAVPQGGVLVRGLDAAPDLGDDPAWERLELQPTSGRPIPDLLSLSVWRRRDA